MLAFAIKETRGVERITQKRERAGLAVEKDPQVAGGNVRGAAARKSRKE